MKIADIEIGATYRLASGADYQLASHSLAKITVTGLGSRGMVTGDVSGFSFRGMYAEAMEVRSERVAGLWTDDDERTFSAVRVLVGAGIKVSWNQYGDARPMLDPTLEQLERIVGLLVADGMASVAERLFGDSEGAA